MHADHMGAPRQITDTQGNVVWRWDNQDPFGNNIPNENPNGAGQFSFNLRFPGQYADRETNTYYNINRDYDPAIGAYKQSDPIGLGGGINTYTYVEGNPLSYTDPSGEIGILGAAVGGGVELGLQAYRNYSKGCDIFNRDNYDWWDVGVSAAVGALGPGWLSVGKTSLRSGSAIKTLSSQLDRAQTANRAAKIEQRIANHQNEIADALITQGAFQGAKAIGKAADGNNSCGCGR
ncbi:MAG: RHS domain-containing protein [Gallionella sp.]|nr:RHS domain-containing protein [Gallionella sp.]MDD4947500.1 RHS domain-containing protein [Gallionella sp.]